MFDSWYTNRMLADRKVSVEPVDETKFERHASLLNIYDTKASDALNDSLATVK